VAAPTLTVTIPPPCQLLPQSGAPQGAQGPVEISYLSWNRKVQHILASTQVGGAETRCCRGRAPEREQSARHSWRLAETAGDRQLSPSLNHSLPHTKPNPSRAT